MASRAALLLVLGPLAQSLLAPTALLLLAGAPGASAFYLPGVAPQDFKKVGCRALCVLSGAPAVSYTLHRSRRPRLL
jgi:hypothetical protein